MNNPNSEFHPNKLKWILVTAGLILLISIILNLVFVFDIGKIKSTKTTNQQNTYLQEQTNIGQPQINDENILKETHKIDKKINRNGITWLGIKATPNETRTKENYEFWRIDEKNEKLLIDNFPLSICDSITWDLNEKNSIDLLYMDSPCEAYRVNTNIIYNEQGVEQFKMVHNSSEGNFMFQQVHNSEYKVSLIVDGKCEGPIQQISTEPTLSKVLLKGVKLTTYGHENKFTLTKPVEISCSMGYGEVNIDPTITDLIFDEEKIEFTLPNNQKAVISLKTANYAEVEFK